MAKIFLLLYRERIRLTSLKNCYYVSQNNNLNTLQENEFKYKVAIILDVFTGARLGELMGLEWNDIDFKNKEIAINKASQYLPEKGIYTKEPKTSSSYRNVSIPDSVA